MCGVCIHLNRSSFVGWLVVFVFGFGLALFQLLQKVGRLEVLGHRIVHARNYLVDRFLPRLLGVLAALYRPEELAQRLFDDVSEVLRNLCTHICRGSRKRKRAHEYIVAIGSPLDKL